ncbi:MAG: cation:proton antiporter [Nostocoides sp.]
MHAVASGEASSYVSLFWIALAAVGAPLLARASGGYVPATVLLIVLGVVIGPGVGHLASPEGLAVLKQLGLGFLFLLAGYELHVPDLFGRQGGFAWIAWAVGFVVATVVSLVITSESLITAAAFGLTVTSTALGALVPILKERGLMGHRMGRSVMIHGAVGELGPVIAMAILLGGRTPTAALMTLATFGVAALVLVAIPGGMIRRFPEAFRKVVGPSSSSTQMGMRMVVLALTGLMALAGALNLDVVLGAFAAGIILHRLTPPDDERESERLETVANSFFVPAFFVLSGMSLDLKAVVNRPWLLVSVLAAILFIRGGAVYLSERILPTGSGLDNNERIRLSLYSAAGLPIIVAVTEVAVANNLMPADIAAILIAAGSLSLLIFPYVAARIRRHATPLAA